MSSEPAGVPAPPSPEEPLTQRVLRQARTGQLDEDRLLPGKDKRERDLMKKLNKLDSAHQPAPRTGLENHPRAGPPALKNQQSVMPPPHGLRLCNAQDEAPEQMATKKGTPAAT